MDSILITGATGFIGRHLVSRLSAENFNVRLAIREREGNRYNENDIDVCRYDPLADNNNYDEILNQIDVVIHLAGLAHNPASTHSEYLKLNSEATYELAKEANARGIKRMLLLSTVKVHGESTKVEDDKFSALDENSPFITCDAYSQSKLIAEQGLINICKNGRMEFVILRPPLVFGPGVKANFLALLRAVSLSVPLPLAKINNQRSMIYVENLCDIIEKAMYSPTCRNQIYLVKDCDYSTNELIHDLTMAFGKKPLLFHFPLSILKLTGMLLNKSPMIDRLIQSLLIDDTKLRQDLVWNPLVNRSDAIQLTVQWYTQHFK